MSDVHLPRGGLPYSHVLRVMLAYDAKGIRVVGVRRVAMRVPAPATPPPSDKTVGYWVGVEDAAGNLLFHAPIHDPLRRDYEVFGDPGGGRPFRVPSNRTSGQFEILVPDIPQGAQVALHGPPVDLKRAGAAASTTSAPLVQHSLEELRRASEAPDHGSGGGAAGGRP